jgi:hypothetical protein
MDCPSGSRSCITLEEFPVVSHLAIDSGHLVESIRNFEVYEDVIRREFLIVSLYFPNLIHIKISYNYKSSNMFHKFVDLHSLANVKIDYRV